MFFFMTALSCKFNIQGSGRDISTPELYRKAMQQKVPFQYYKVRRIRCAAYTARRAADFCRPLLRSFSHDWLVCFIAHLLNSDWFVSLRLRCLERRFCTAFRLFLSYCSHAADPHVGLDRLPNGV